MNEDLTEAINEMRNDMTTMTESIGRMVELLEAQARRDEVSGSRSDSALEDLRDIAQRFEERAEQGV